MPPCGGTIPNETPPGARACIIAMIGGTGGYPQLRGTCYETASRSRAEIRAQPAANYSRDGQGYAIAEEDARNAVKGLKARANKVAGTLIGRINFVHFRDSGELCRWPIKESTAFEMEQNVSTAKRVVADLLEMGAIVETGSAGSPSARANVPRRQ